eukprot:gb/GECH01001110.1/.p1 GENE.gb/GECH01001110.1/~~gb/GECH01001110.1/.p1  ORF type:complete len:214 (+),score=55.36 gb/GECH01001110.1/:1-642(+)
MRTYQVRRRRGALGSSSINPEENESNESRIPEMNKFHRGLLQLILAHGAIKTERLNNFLEKRGKNPDNLKRYIAVINTHIEKFHMRISPFNRLKYFIVCNEIEDDLSKFATTWSQQEIDLYRNILKTIVENEVKPINRSDAIELRNSNMTVNIAERAINKFISERALDEKNNSRVTLGIRAAAELRNYIEHEFGVNILAGRSAQQNNKNNSSQ